MNNILYNFLADLGLQSNLSHLDINKFEIKVITKLL